MHYFRNNGDGTFTERDVQRPGSTASWAGSTSSRPTTTTTAAWTSWCCAAGGKLPQRKSLLRNNCDGTFTDVTAASGLARAGDEHADRGVGRHRQRRAGSICSSATRIAPAQLFRNKGGTARSRTSLARRASIASAFTKGVSARRTTTTTVRWTSTSRISTATNFLYRNNHDNTFTEMARAAGVPGPGHGFATWFFDYDNDGWPDLFATSYFTSVDESVRTYLGLPHNAATLKLYRNLRRRHLPGRDGGRSASTRCSCRWAPTSATSTTTAFSTSISARAIPSYASLLPNVLLRNKEGKSFVDVTASSGTGELHKGHGVAFADLDNDGDEDIVAEIGGATPGDGHRAAAVRESRPRQRLDQPEAGRRQDQPRGDRRADQRDGRKRRAADPRDPSHRRQRRVVRRLAASSSTSAWASRRGSSTSRSGGRPATPASASRASRRTRPWRSRSWRGATPTIERRPIAGRNEEGPMTRRSWLAAALMLACLRTRPGPPSRRRPGGRAGVFRDRHGAEGRSLPPNLHRLDSSDPRRSCPR